MFIILEGESNLREGLNVSNVPNTRLGFAIKGNHNTYQNPDDVIWKSIYTIIIILLYFHTYH